MKTLKELLIQFDACAPAIKWAGDKTIEEVVKECHRGDWLLWLAKKIELPERKIISCAGDCANTVRHLMKDERSTKVVDLCMNFEDESISFEELEIARDDARAAYAAAYDDADEAYLTARAYAARAAARDARALAAEAAARAAAAAAYKDNQLQTANIVRERLGNDIVNKVNQLLNN